MKKIVYTVAFLLASTLVGPPAQAQTRIKENKNEIADMVLFQDNILIYTQKDREGQYLYTERKGQGGIPQKDGVLNAGTVNSLIGVNQATGEVYVYQKAGRKEEKISVYRWGGDSFSKVEERPLPRMRNNSYNLGMFLTQEKDALYISAELVKTKGYDDIYLSRWENGRWTKPKNMGSPVNSRQGEFAPCVANDSLFFSRKQGQEAYVYAVPLGKGGAMPSSEPVQLKESVNQPRSFNAYYKKVDDQEMWISLAPEENTYVAYVAKAQEEVPVLQPVMLEQPTVAKQAVSVPAPAVALAKPAATFDLASPNLQFFYAPDVVFIKKEDVGTLEAFLTKLPAGTALLLKGYSDRTGSEEVRERVSKRRSSNLEWYINRYHADKGFTVEVRHELLPAKGPNLRKTELFVAK